MAEPVKSLEPSRVPAVKQKTDDVGLSREDHQHLARAWEATIAAAIAHRKPWLKAYQEAEKFAYESHDFIYEGVYNQADFRSTVPKVWEMLNIFGPMAAYKEPFRRVRPRYERPQDERAPFAAVMQMLLNYTTHEFDWRQETRQWTDEGILGGLGTMWLERDASTGLVTHLYDSAQNIVVDPDATLWRNAYWIARRRLIPRWMAARQLGADPKDPQLPRMGHLVEDLHPPTAEDSAEWPRRGATFSADDVLSQSARGKTSELLEVWEVYSKMGLGWRLKEANYVEYGPEKFGDYPRFFIVPGSGKLWMPTEWPVPLWADRDWPVEFLAWRYRPQSLWPISMIRPVLGMQKALDWFVTLFLHKLKTTSRDFIAVAKDMEEELREKIKNGFDLEILDIDPSDLEDRRIGDLVQFLQHPPMNTDAWRVYDLLQSLFERASGLYSQLYSESGPTQSRSATESEYRESRADLRPDDMRNVVENSHARMARREAIASRLLYEPDQVAEVLGPAAGDIWKEYQEGDLSRVMREFDYHVEAGSIAKPNIEKEHRDAAETFDRAMQVAVNVMDFEAINKLLLNLQRSRNIPEADMVFVQPPPPQPNPEQQKAEAQIEATKQKMELDAQKAQLDAQTKLQAAQLDLEIAKIKAMGDVKMQEVKIQTERAAGSQKLEQADEAHEQKLKHQEAIGKQKVKLAGQKPKAKPKSKGKKKG